MSLWKLQNITKINKPFVSFVVQAVRFSWARLYFAHQEAAAVASTLFTRSGLLRSFSEMRRANAIITKHNLSRGGTIYCKSSDCCTLVCRSPFSPFPCQHGAGSGWATQHPGMVGCVSSIQEPSRVLTARRAEKKRKSDGNRSPRTVRARAFHHHIDIISS